MRSKSRSQRHSRKTGQTEMADNNEQVVVDACYAVGRRGLRRGVPSLFSEMKSRGVIGKRQLYWVESVAIPLHQDHNVIDYKDWRTYHRLLLFDNIVKQALKSFNCARVVPAFQSTLVSNSP